jgi:hypothetical protein
MLQYLLRIRVWYDMVSCRASERVFYPVRGFITRALCCSARRSVLGTFQLVEEYKVRDVRPLVFRRGVLAPNNVIISFSPLSRKLSFMDPKHRALLV